jgi:pimeloyl-ACP methyl ester carboxylesterase
MNLQPPLPPSPSSSPPRSSLAATSAFYGRGPVIRALRAAFSASQRMWPALAVRMALRLFGTPLPPRWLQRRAAWDARWRRETWSFGQSSLTLHRLRVAPPGPPVLLVHGWGGQAAQMLPLAEAMLRHGLEPLLVDMPAHGMSAGRISNLPQFARAIDYLSARLAQEGRPPRAVVAHSLAANAAAHAASRGLPTARLVLLAPPASPRDYTDLFAGVFGLSEATRSAMQARIEAREGFVMQQFDASAVGPRIDVPTLVVHDVGDSINRIEDGMAFAEAITGAQLLRTEGLGHRKILKDAAVIERVAQFVRL